MSVINQSPYLRTSRLIPETPEKLPLELSRMYIDIASAVNLRTIGIFSPNKSSIGGESWYVAQNKRQQNLRQIYPFTDSASPILIPHNINFNDLTNFVRIWGTFSNNNIWYTLPYVDVTAATNQISISVNSTNIVITKGSGAPAMTNPMIILEWLSNV